MRKEFLLPNFALLALGVVFACLAVILSRRVQFSVPIVTLIVFLLSCAGTYFCYFKTGWDAGLVTDKAWSVALGGKLDIPDGYYSFYTNNILIHCYEYGIFRLCILLGITELQHAMYVLVFMNCLVSAVSAILVYDSLLMLYPSSKTPAYLGYVFYLGLIMLSPWVLVAYTDSLALVLPILTIWLYLKLKANNKSYMITALFGVLICFVGFFAYKLKATAGIVLIAVILTEIISVVRAFKDAKARTIVRAAVSLIILTSAYFMSNKLYIATYT
ncbi:MAG: hypothetical protein J5959_19770, partial [Butyrivibrio sp.]|nr:hypothetical protein [Butyrivibrio sp.]